MRDAVYMKKFFKINYKYRNEGRHWYCMELDKVILSEGNRQIRSRLKKDL